MEKANLEAEIQNTQEAYAIGSVSLLQADEVKKTRSTYEKVKAYEAKIETKGKEVDAKELNLLEREKQLRPRDELETKAQCMIRYLQDKGEFDDYNQKQPQIFSQIVQENLEFEAKMAELYRKFPHLRPKQQDMDYSPSR